MTFVNEKTLERAESGHKKAPPLWGEALKAFIIVNPYSAFLIETSLTMSPLPCMTSAFTWSLLSAFSRNL